MAELPVELSARSLDWPKSVCKGLVNHIQDWNTTVVVLANDLQELVDNGDMTQGDMNRALVAKSPKRVGEALLGFCGNFCTDKRADGCAYELIVEDGPEILAPQSTETTDISLFPRNTQQAFESFRLLLEQTNEEPVI